MEAPSKGERDAPGSLMTSCNAAGPTTLARLHSTSFETSQLAYAVRPVRPLTSGGRCGGATTGPSGGTLRASRSAAAKAGAVVTRPNGAPSSSGCCWSTQARRGGEATAPAGAVEAYENGSTGGVFDGGAGPPAAAIVVAGRSPLLCRSARPCPSGTERDECMPLKVDDGSRSDEEPTGRAPAPVEAARLRGGGRRALGSSELSDESAAASERRRAVSECEGRSRRRRGEEDALAPKVGSRACMRVGPPAAVGMREVGAGAGESTESRPMDEDRAGCESSSAARRYCDCAGAGRGAGSLNEGRAEGGSKCSMRAGAGVRRESG